jgi:hypothetical protein
MISAWWLGIIIPGSVFIGVMMAALCVAASGRDKTDDT